MKLRKWKDVARENFTPPELEEIEKGAQADLLEMSLRDMREMVGKTQVELSAAAEIAQSEISKIERRDDLFLSTLRKYVEALGGELEVVANFGNKRVKVLGV